MKLGIDTNTLISGSLWQGPPAQLLEAVLHDLANEVLFLQNAGSEFLWRQVCDVFLGARGDAGLPPNIFCRISFSAASGISWFKILNPACNPFLLSFPPSLFNLSGQPFPFKVQGSRFRFM